MGEQTAIEWCHHTFNPAIGCAPVSEGCRNCYATARAKQWGYDSFGYGPDGNRKELYRLTGGYWRQPLSWNRKAESAGERRRVFCGSMCDVFDDHPTMAEQRERLWLLIRATPWLDWLLLTKRPENILLRLPEDWEDRTDGCGYKNVWLGTTMEADAYAWHAEVLKAIPAELHFVSVEPALGPLDQLDLCGIDWVIWGGETGPKRRPADLQWARDLRDRCRAAGVPFFFKQAGGLRPGQGETLDGELIREFPRSKVT